MGTGIDPKVDYAFKRVFGSEENRDILTNLLNAIFAGSSLAPIRDVELLNPFSFKDVADDRLSILDIKARDDQQRESLIEMQNLAHADYRGRLVYYAAKHLSQTLSEGADYSKLGRVIVVCLLNDVLFGESAEHHSRFELIDGDSGLRFSDHLSIHVIELPKFQKTLAQLDSELDRWIYFLKHGEELDVDQFPPQLQTSEIRKAAGVLNMLSHSSTERDLYEARQMAQPDEAARIKTALAKGRLEGRLQAANAALLKLGTRLLGQPSPEVLGQLQQADVDRLEAMMERLMDVASWDELLHRN